MLVTFVTFVVLRVLISCWSF